MPLSTRERAILDLERTWWSHARSKEATIRQELGLSPTRYYQLLTALLDSGDAMAYDPLVVRRLQRHRTVRRRTRWEGRPAGGTR